MFTDRPTITYTPLTGSKFLGNLLMPIEPAAPFSALQCTYVHAKQPAAEKTCSCCGTPRLRVSLWPSLRKCGVYGRVRGSVPNPGNAASMFGFVIHSSAEEPEDACVSANYRNRYYYIGDRDMNSKRLFSLIMLLYALAEGGVQQALPTLTIPTQ